MLQFTSEIDEAAAAIGRLWECRPRVGIILGTGLGGFVDHIEVDGAIPFDRMPHFARSTADGHDGRLVCGRLAGVSVITMSGRCHGYEGYSSAQITLPVRLMRALGVRLLILSNASGGMNPSYRSGDVMVIEDHINLMGRKLRLDYDQSLPGKCGSAPPSWYCSNLIELALASGRNGGFAAHRGVYAAMTGPNYETRAEYRMLRAIGADAVGMSTVPEVLVAARCGMRVLALSTITNICVPDRLTPARHEDVLAAAAAAEPKVRRIIIDVVVADSEPEVCRERPPCRSIAQVDAATPLSASGTPLRAFPTEGFAELPKQIQGR
ncbi:MAG: purine-nucleoside phosphorylase [Pirellulales bacterium]